MKHQNYINIIDATPMPCIWGELKKIDSKKNHEFRILGANNSTSNLFNLDKNKIIGMDILDLFKITNPKHADLSKLMNKERYSIDEYIPALNLYYKIELDMIDNNIFVIWLVKSYQFDKYMLNLLDKLGCMTWVKDVSGRYIKTNIASTLFPGTLSSDLVGKTASDCFIKEQAAILDKDHNRLISGEVKSISKLIFLNGICYDHISFPVYDINNKIIGTVGFANEVADIISSNKDSHSQKKLIELIGDNIPDHIFFKDVNGVFIYCNESFAKYKGLKKTDIVGKGEFEIESNMSPCKHISQDMEVIESRTEIVYENDITLEDGKKIYMETIKVPFIDKNGIVGGVLGISRNISSRRESELELDRLRMEFFANLSHEFRTPLNLIFSSIQLFDRKLSDITNNVKCLNCYNNISYKYLNIMRQNGFRLLKLVNNLIDLTRLDVGSLEYSPVDYNIVAYVEDVFESVVDFAKLNKIKMIFDTTIEEKIIAFDLDKMERIILNLLSNAIKFNKDNGHIYIFIDCDDDFVKIQVKDTGVGIPNDKLGEVFEKFRQVSNRFTKISEGSGIGLSLVKSLVELHNGTIEVASVLNEYTIFTIKIPNVTLSKRSKNIDISTPTPNIELEFSDIYNI
ncbi:PAS domain-containing sensor histidine kinase [Romboutsia weinsteinii]|uniref:PAS domain-containing sensor histidine kinase n=1 Tax=Romboutsia weinsteinii TaxID=2020949 RepID=UPI001314728F|nr:PAS domain-containing sensor histidine kinase [Romboutsia weinsteinii]